jgi:predicted phosphoribosyltransferase/pimeloyl-ACP methyl ester carboxylesterase
MLDSVTRQLEIHGRILEADLAIPTGAKAMILFAHGSGSSRHSTRNQYVAEVLNKAGFATLLVDLLSSEEKPADKAGRHLRYNIELLAGRFIEVTKWLLQQSQTKNLEIGYFGSSTGAAAAIIAAVNFSNDIVKALVLRSGRLDLVEGQLSKIIAPTFLIVGGSDNATVIGINKTALKELKNAKDRELAVIPGAGHLFEEPGKIEDVAKIATEWFEIYLLCSGKKFENKYPQKNKSSALLSSIFGDRPHIQLKFKDRLAAGEILAVSLGRYKKEEEEDNANPAITVIGIPRGGVVVADAVARKLAIRDFDIVIPRKLRAPNNSENAIGAIMQDGSVYLEDILVESMNVSNQYLEMEKSQQKKEIDRRMGLYRPETSKEYKIKCRTVFLVDDGAATGATIIAAAGWIRKQNPKRLIIALPVAPSQIKMALRQQANDLEIIYAPNKFTSVEQFYQKFEVLSDKEIIKLLEEYRKAPT